MTATDTETLPPTVNTRISPRGGLDILSRDEVARLRDASTGGQRDLLRRCALAVLTTGSESDDPRAAAQRYPTFDIEVQQQDRGIKIRGQHIDVFTGKEVMTRLWNRLVPSNRGVTVILDSPFCAPPVQVQQDSEINQQPRSGTASGP